MEHRAEHEVDVFAVKEGTLFGKGEYVGNELVCGMCGAPIAASWKSLGRTLRLSRYDEALKAASEYQDIFGKDRYFLELMDHGIEIERRVRDGLLEIGKKLGIPPLVTNDSHYTYAHEATAHDALLCIQTGKNLSDPDRFRFDGTGYYLKSTDEMYAIDSSDAWQQGCANTLLVAEQIDTTGMFEAKNLMPKFDIPEGFTEVTWFKEEVRRGMDRRFPGGVPEDRQKQVEYEMDVIIQMGFPGYFLVVADFIMWAKKNGIAVGPGRGSAAGSIVAYAMGITDLTLGASATGWIIWWIRQH